MGKKMLVVIQKGQLQVSGVTIPTGTEHKAEEFVTELRSRSGCSKREAARRLKIMRVADVVEATSAMVDRKIDRVLVLLQDRAVSGQMYEVAVEMFGRERALLLDEYSPKRWMQATCLFVEGSLAGFRPTETYVPPKIGSWLQCSLSKMWMLAFGPLKHICQRRSKEGGDKCCCVRG